MKKRVKKISRRKNILKRAFKRAHEGDFKLNNLFVVVVLTIGVFAGVAAMISGNFDIRQRASSYPNGTQCTINEECTSLYCDTCYNAGLDKIYCGGDTANKYCLTRPTPTPSPSTCGVECYDTNHTCVPDTVLGGNKCVSINELPICAKPPPGIRSCNDYNLVGCYSYEGVQQITNWQTLTHPCRCDSSILKKPKDNSMVIYYCTN